MSQTDGLRLRAARVNSDLHNRYSATFLVTTAKPPLSGAQVYLWLVAPPLSPSRDEFMSSRLTVLEKNGEEPDLASYIWSLIRTFVPKDVGPNSASISVEDVIVLIEAALSGDNPKLLESLDKAVARSKTRIAAKIQS